MNTTYTQNALVFMKLCKFKTGKENQKQELLSSL